MRSKLMVGLLVGALVAVLAPTAAVAQGPRPATYEVTIYNLTGGQPLTPPVLATHDREARFFRVGRPAGEGVQQVAENGNAAPLLDALGANPEVFDIVTGDAPLVPAADPGGSGFSSSATFTIEAARGAKFLSWISMLICTNDGFTGLDTVRLPLGVGQTFEFYTGGYDAGTEINTEDFADIVPPCQGLIGVSSDDEGTGETNPALYEGSVVLHHPGIAGGADLLPGVHGWADPVAKVVVTRTS